jgi:hypothetical protein
VATGVIEACKEFELAVGKPAAGRFQFQSKRVALVPEKEVAGAGEYAHAFENCAGVPVAPFTVGDMQPKHARLSA